MIDRFEDNSTHNLSRNEIEYITDMRESHHSPVESLLDQLNFHPTPALEEASKAIVAGLEDKTTDQSHLKRAWIEYSKIAEGIVESIENSDENPKTYAKAQIGATIHKSLIFFATGNTLRYLEELDLAEARAHDEHIDTVRDALLSEIDHTIDTLEMSPEVLVIKLKRVIDEDNRAYLRDLIEQGDDFEDILGSVYGMLLEEGKDPDEVLAELGIIEH